ncbi:MAG: hypothetical protein KF754_15000 [Planctomycetes bacterium]|nr:hypothetical protein [Planctomycetota bacterium]
MELVISRPGSTGDRYITARVSDTTSSTIVVADVGGASAPVYAALNGQTQGFVVYDFYTGDNTTGGEWTDDPNHLPFLNVTRFTDENADFQSYMVGWTIIADVEKPSFLTIFAVPTATRVEVFGDATGLGADGKTYRLVAPPGVDPTTGALSKPNTVLSKRANNRGCQWLWSGYQYVPPQVGHESGGSTTGAQGGINELGTCYCWNRTYDVFMGRWTTPDPAATPWGNLWDYCMLRANQLVDATGLECTITDLGFQRAPRKWSSAIATGVSRESDVDVIEKSTRIEVTNVESKSDSAEVTGKLAGSYKGAGGGLTVTKKVEKTTALQKGSATTVSHRFIVSRREREYTVQDKEWKVYKVEASGCDACTCGHIGGEIDFKNGGPKQKVTPMNWRSKYEHLGNADGGGILCADRDSQRDYGKAYKEWIGDTDKETLKRIKADGSTEVVLEGADRTNINRKAQEIHDAGVDAWLR